MESQDMKEWLEDKAEHKIWETRNKYALEQEELACKYRALFLEAERRGIHLNCAAIANITATHEKAKQKYLDALAKEIDAIREEMKKIEE
jgi:DNA-binding XRE family transcriptional regulator